MHEPCTRRSLPPSWPRTPTLHCARSHNTKWLANNSPARSQKSCDSCPQLKSNGVPLHVPLLTLRKKRVHGPRPGQARSRRRWALRCAMAHPQRPASNWLHRHSRGRLLIFFPLRSTWHDKRSKRHTHQLCSKAQPRGTTAQSRISHGAQTPRGMQTHILPHSTQRPSHTPATHITAHPPNTSATVQYL